MTKAKDRCFRLTLTLACGQAFRWHDCGILPFPLAYGGLAREWAGVVGTRLLVLRQAEQEPPDGADDPVWWRVAAGAEAGAADVVHDYFRLGHDQTEIVARFCDADPRYNTAFPIYRGCRVIRQDPVECLFGFICSSNNNVKRISSMVLQLAKRYGTSLGVHAGREHFLFPRVESLAEQVCEEELRQFGFGYRAKYIAGTADLLQKDADEVGMSAEDFLHTYRGLERKEVAKKLVKYPGVGRKVAGCVALFSLDQLGEIPCDTHIWQIATRYLPELKQKSLTDRVYDQVGDFFRARFSEEYAGLAQTMLFVGELSDFKSLADSENGTRTRKKREGISVKVEPKEEDLAIDSSSHRGPIYTPATKRVVLTNSPTGDGITESAKGHTLKKHSPSSKTRKRRKVQAKAEAKKENIQEAMDMPRADDTSVTERENKEGEAWAQSPIKRRRTETNAESEPNTVTPS